MKREENIRKTEAGRPETEVQSFKLKVQCLKNTERVTCNPEPATIKRNLKVFIIKFLKEEGFNVLAADFCRYSF